MTELPDRRGSRRRRIAAEHGIDGARLRLGHGVELIDVSASGALLEAAHRLLPGSAVELLLARRHLRVAIRGRVLRCAVSQLGHGRITYLGAIAFDIPLSWLTEPEAPTIGESENPHGARRSDREGTTHDET